MLPCNGHEILQDALDLVNWTTSQNTGLNEALRQVGERLSIEPSRIVVAGSSAGSYLAYLAAVRAQPEYPLRGVLSMYGMGGNFLVRSEPSLGTV